MTVTSRCALTVVLAGSLFVSAGSAQAPLSGSGALRAAIDTEMIRGNDSEAARMYRQVADTFAKSDRLAAAQALTRLGALYEKLQDAVQARAAYTRVVSEFPDQAQSRQVAQERLAQLPASAAGAFLSADVTARLPQFGNWGFSADGKFVILGLPQGTGGPPGPALVVRNLETGEETTVATRLPGFSPHMPSFSPDGRFVGAWLQVGARGGESPWGYSLVVSRFAPGTKPTVLPSLAGTNAEMGPFMRDDWLNGRIVWSPDSRFVPFTAPLDRGGAHGVRLVDLQTGRDRALSVEVIEAPDFTWSPSGDRLAVRVEKAGAVQINIVTIATGAVTVVSVPPPADGHTARLRAWTMRDEFLVRYGARVPSAPIEFRLLDSRTGAMRTTCKGARPNVNVLYGDNSRDVCLGLSTDGARQLRWDATLRRLMVRDTESGRDTPLTTASGDEHFGQLSPDGRVVAFISNRSGSWGMYAAPLDQAPVARPALVQSFSSLPGGVDLYWHRDGWLARTSINESNVYRVPMDPATGRNSGPLERLTHDRVDNWFPSVSPDGASIAYLSQQNARVGLSLMDASGANERVIFDRSRIGLMSVTWRSPTDLLFLGVSEGQSPQSPGPRLLHAWDVRTGTVREIAKLPPPEPRATYELFNYMKTTDEVVFVNHDGVATTTIRARRLSDGQERIVATFDIGPGFLHDYRVSPDDKRMAFSMDRTSRRGTCRPCEMGIVSLDTGERRMLPPPPQLPLFSAWSPDGRFLVYGWLRPRVIDTLTGESWQLINEQSHPVPEGLDLTEWGEDAEASWSPDGRSVVLSLGRTQREWRRWSGITADALAKMAGGK